jgi:hypothetical protein
MHKVGLYASDDILMPKEYLEMAPNAAGEKNLLE